MNPLISPAADLLWHNLKRFAGVILIAVFCAGVPYLVYNKGYSKGYSKGYAQCAMDRPTYSNVGTVTNNADDGLKKLGFIFKFFFIKLKIGI